MVIQVLGNQDMCNAQQQGQIASGTHAQPAVGNSSRTAAPRVNHDNLRPTATGIVERIDGPIVDESTSERPRYMMQSVCARSEAGL